jgi:hypothetical protein
MKAWSRARRFAAVQSQIEARRLTEAVAQDGLPVGRELSEEIQALRARALRGRAEAEAIEQLDARRSRARRRARARRA